ncbi:hypothetical protein QLQ85_03545 [Halomonas sp. M4R5S39]|uniref:hypothetical protein n=1 Tax=Halomonas kalidii TaxID=3043293 RepID=UPI0024A94F32|nr:hypothetical protein [Halomonas kalidii]MDI5983853.1 hypothetical protein [Halomonas kalidii]
MPCSACPGEAALAVADACVARLVELGDHRFNAIAGAPYARLTDDRHGIKETS